MTIGFLHFSVSLECGEDVYSVSDAVDHIGFGWFQIKIMLLLGYFSAADALEMMLLSILAPTIRCIFRISAWKEAWITTVVFIGMMVGSSTWGWIADNFGRKFVIVLVSIWIAYFGLLSAFSPHYYWIIVLRMVVGLGIGGAPQSATLMSEFLPSKYRAMCMCIQSPWWTLGSLFTICVAMLVMPVYGWRYLLALLSLPMFLFLLLSPFLPESCRFQLASGDRDKALATLHRMARANKATLPTGFLKDANQNAKRGRILDLLKPELRRTTLMLWFLWFNVAFTYYGVVLMTSELFQSDSAGGGKCEVKDPHCGCKLLTTKDYTDMMWTTLAEIPIVLVNIVLLERLGRRRTLALLYGLTATFYMLLFICTKREWMVAFIFGARGCISGVFTAIYIYTPEVVLPYRGATLGLGTCSAVARIGAMITPFICQVLLRASVDFALGVYAATGLSCVVIALCLPIETKGRLMRVRQH
ncbi:predicted protein, partial [Nematostella vectensis]